MQLTEEFKKGMREFMLNAFDRRPYLLCSPYSLNSDISFDETNWVIYAPLFVKDEIINFFKAEGLNVSESRIGLYSISLVT